MADFFGNKKADFRKNIIKLRIIMYFTFRNSIITELTAPFMFGKAGCLHFINQPTTIYECITFYGIANPAGYRIGYCVVVCLFLTGMHKHTDRFLILPVSHYGYSTDKPTDCIFHALWNFASTSIVKRSNLIKIFVGNPPFDV